ncbi:MAG: hypothetical protein V7641_3507 [Blastocatellia bacterium]
MKNKLACLKSFTSLVLLGVVVLCVSAPATAGVMHARAVIGLGVSAQFAPHGGVAHAERHQGSKYRIAHEEFGNNYTYGNAGSGHAHHHSGLARSSDGGSQESDNREAPATKPPVPGSRGTSQYVKQTWLPNASGDKIEITWTSDSFLQIDPSEITPGGQVVSRASITASGGLNGTVEISARLKRGQKPQIVTQLTGIFRGVKFELVSHPGGVVSLQFRQPLKWAVRGNAETFDIALDASID